MFNTLLNGSNYEIFNCLRLERGRGQCTRKENFFDVGGNALRKENFKDFGGGGMERNFEIF